MENDPVIIIIAFVIGMMLMMITHVFVFSLEERTIEPSQCELNGGVPLVTKGVCLSPDAILEFDT